ncbi:hypothetical protein [Xanthomonas hortorum]|uniref:Abi-alpha family protein n=1 Tax=Xanthomonas hortorum TaxID=56454 RepID=UPI0029362BFA|nr:hypothetical protein [Xanthomonas hortorum]MDV2452768.1 hypothetical protein [Xanthomonas hortorum NBC5720]
MNSNNLPSEIKSQVIDYVAAGAKSVLGAIPFAGSLLVELAGTIIPNQRIERIANFAAALEDRIKHLEESEIIAELSDETFNELTEEALRQAARSTSQERRNYLASLVASSLTDDQITNNEHRHLLRLLGEISDVEVVWLRSLVGSYIGEPDNFRRTHETTLAPVRAYLGSRQDELDKHTLQQSYISHLIALGLAKRSLKLDKNKQPQVDSSTKDFAYESTSITPLGRMLLRTLDLWPEQEGAG